MLGEVESLECEHLDAVVVGCSAATGRGRVSEGHATTGRKVCGAQVRVVAQVCRRRLGWRRRQGVAARGGF